MALSLWYLGGDHSRNTKDKDHLSEGDHLGGPKVDHLGEPEGDHPGEAEVDHLVVMLLLLLLLSFAIHCNSEEVYLLCNNFAGCQRND